MPENFIILSDGETWDNIKGCHVLWNGALYHLPAILEFANRNVDFLLPCNKSCKAMDEIAEHIKNQ